MADQKISQLTDGGASQATDEYVIARSGNNFRIDGASVAAAATSVGTLASLNVTGNVNNAALTASRAVFTDASKNLVSNAITGTGNVVMSASPTFTGTATFATATATTLTEGTAAVVVQTDLGSAPNEVPLNQYLGQLAFQDNVFYPVQAGTGITAGVGTVYGASASMQGGMKVVTVVIDLTGLNSGGTAGDIIGVNGTANPCHIGQLPSFVPMGGRMTCLEVPAGGDTDLDLFSATEGTGVEDQAITALTETQLVDAGGAWTLNLSRGFLADPTSAGFLYLVGQGTANATYTAGRFLIEVFGV